MKKKPMSKVKRHLKNDKKTFEKQKMEHKELIKKLPKGC